MFTLEQRDILSYHVLLCTHYSVERHAPRRVQTTKLAELSRGFLCEKTIALLSTRLPSSFASTISSSIFLSLSHPSEIARARTRTKPDNWTPDPKPGNIKRTSNICCRLQTTDPSYHAL